MQHFLSDIAAQKAADLRARAAAASAIRVMRRQAPATGMRRFARRVTAVVAECNAAQRRLTELNTSVDRYLPDPHRAPDTYAEFLTRTRGSLRREPTADGRLAGQSVR